MRQAGFFLVLVLWTATSFAANNWLEASSDHFVIYSDQDAKAVTSFSERLELFHSAMSQLSSVPVVKASPSNRVTIFVVSNPAEIQKLVGTDNKYVNGIYLPRAGASVALIPKRSDSSGKYALKPETVLYHEYAHHFMWGLTSSRFPRWFTEGYAEFFAGVKFQEDSVGIGVQPLFRVAEIVYARNVPLRAMLDSEGSGLDKASEYDAFYGQSWLLMHYLHFDPQRAGQLVKYQQLLGTGKTALEAAEGAFGDLDRLEDDLEKYSMQRRMSYLSIPRSELPLGPIRIRVLPPSEAAIMPTRIRSRSGVDEEEAAVVVANARSVASKYPNDAVVLTALAEAEFDAGLDNEAIAAADRSLALDPNQINAFIQKGYALARRVRKDKLPDTAWKDVRQHWVKANKLENDNPIPLLQFYDTYLEQGIEPTKNAIAGLEWAMVLAPFDTTIRWQVVQQMIRDERLQEAVVTLEPLAYSPHPGEFTERARQLLQQVEDRIAEKKSGT